MSEEEAKETIVAAWLSLPAEDRRLRQQAIAFAQVQASRRPFSGAIAHNIQILSWLLPTLPRPGKAAQAG